MNEIIGEGLALMCIGMGTVLTFLCTLIISMRVMSFVVGKLNLIFPEAALVAAKSGMKTVSTNDEAVAVAIAAAVASK